MSKNIKIANSATPVGFNLGNGLTLLQPSVFLLEIAHGNTMVAQDPVLALYFNMLCNS